jgi:hypothetical protein
MTIWKVKWTPIENLHMLLENSFKRLQDKPFIVESKYEMRKLWIYEIFDIRQHDPKVCHYL